MKEIILWITLWFLTWGIFNWKFNWNQARTTNQKYIVPSLFFIFGISVSCLIFGGYIYKYVDILIVSFFISLFIGIFLSEYYPYYKHIKNGKYFLISLTFDILYQQIMVIAGIHILNSYFGSSYHYLYFGLLFMLGHLPVLLFKWAKLRFLYLALTFFGGILFSYTLNNFGINVALVNVLIHYSIYTIFFYNLRDERKI